MHYKIYSLLVPTKFTSYLCRQICSNLEFLCQGGAYLLATNNFGLSDHERFKVLLGHYPAGASIKVAFQFLQNIRTGQPTTGFDYRDEQINISKYGEASPPELDLESLKNLGVPVSIFAGSNDILATVMDIRQIKDLLGPNTLYYYEELKADHISFLIGKDMTYFTERAIGILHEHQPL